MNDKTWGGARPGSGRKPVDPKSKKVQMTVTIERETRDELRLVSIHRGIHPGKMVDLLVSKHLDDVLLMMSGLKINKK